MIIIGMFTDERYGVTEGKEYKVIFEYDTVYEVKCDNDKIYCRPKGFYKVKE